MARKRYPDLAKMTFDIRQSQLDWIRTESEKTFVPQSVLVRNAIELMMQSRQEPKTG